MQSHEHIKGKNPWKYDVAVLCIFFVRDDCFQASFEAVRHARPKTLLLWQDGPRSGHETDREHWLECQRIAADIDWDCDVYRYYHEENIGIWPGAFHSHKWAFSIVEKCIILEDDVVPSESFFHFCEILLDKYKDDDRVAKITGMNQVEGFDCPYDYFFSETGSVWGWATWRRVADTWDEHYSFLNDKYTLNLLKKKYNSKADMDYLNVCIGHSKENRAHWETVSSFSRYLNSQLCIVPTRNMVHNVGVGTENSVHMHSSLNDFPKKLRKAYFGEAEEISFPLKHPPYLIDNTEYMTRLFNIVGNGHPLISFFNRIERYFLTIKNGHIKSLLKGIKRRLASSSRN